MRIFEQYFMGCCYFVCLSSGPVCFQVQLEKFSKFEAYFEVVEGEIYSDMHRAFTISCQYFRLLATSANGYPGGEGINLIATKLEEGRT